MRNEFIPITALLFFAVFASITTANDDCICAKVPFYPVPGGWLHYAMVCDIVGNDCNEDYPTSFVYSSPLTGRSCDNCSDCGTCVDTYSSSTASVPPLNFKNRLSYATLSDAEDFRLFLNAINGDAYATHVFRNPQVLEIGRGTNTFFAIVYEVEYQDGTDVATGYMGVEVSDVTAPMGTSPIQIPNGNRHNAVVTRKAPGGLRHTRVEGLLQVRYTEGNQVRVAHLQLHDSPANDNAHYPNFKTNVSYGGNCCPPCYSSFGAPRWRGRRALERR